MKNTLKYLAIFLLTLSITLVSCGGDDSGDDDQVDGNLNASYEFKIDGEIVSSNSSIPLGMLLDANGIAKQVSVAEPDNLFGMLFSTIPENTGEVKPLDGDTLIVVTGNLISDYNIQIVVDEGTMTRVAKNKVSFIGTFEHNGGRISASGFIKSEGIK